MATSGLLTILALLYQMQDGDIKALADELLDRPRRSRRA